MSASPEKRAHCQIVNLETYQIRDHNSNDEIREKEGANDDASDEEDNTRGVNSTSLQLQEERTFFNLKTEGFFFWFFFFLHFLQFASDWSLDGDRYPKELQNRHPSILCHADEERIQSWNHTSQLRTEWLLTIVVKERAMCASCVCVPSDIFAKYNGTYTAKV